MSPSISIIIPVYNVEAYLKRCLESITKQTHTNIEIILVDDGSTDASGAICDEYVVVDSRVSVVHKENGGQADARNVGMLAATCDYIMFVDSDDYIETDACQRFVDCLFKCPEADVVLGSTKRIENGKVTYMGFEAFEKPISGQELLRLSFGIPSHGIVTWMALFNKRFLLDNKLFFKVGLLHEDTLWTPQAFLKAQKVVSCGYYFYNYIIREGSTTQKKDQSKNIIDAINICYELDEIYSHIQDQELKAIMLDSLIPIYMVNFAKGRLYRKEFDYLIKNNFVDSKAILPKSKAMVALYRLNKPMLCCMCKCWLILKKRKK